MWETNVVEERLAHNFPSLSRAWTGRGPQLGHEELSRALECEEFELHYQPQVELTTGRWVGLEACLRWRHPEYGLLSPEPFLPSLETSSRLTQALGLWVVQQVDRQHRAWRRQGRRCPIAVNLSLGQIECDTFFEALESTLHEIDFDPHYLQLELRETAVTPTADKTPRLERLVAWGVRLALDNFGGRSSSLNSLYQLPVCTIKLDKAFLQPDFPRLLEANKVLGMTLAHDERVALLRAILMMARSLRKTVVAMGVETEAQRRFLIREGCHYGQGSLFAPPRPAAQWQWELQ